MYVCTQVDNLTRCLFYEKPLYLTVFTRNLLAGIGDNPDDNFLLPKDFFSKVWNAF